MRCGRRLCFGAGALLFGAVTWTFALGAGAHDTRAKPADRPGRSQVGTASYFGAELAGKTTAAGGKAKPNALTAASRTLPLGARAKVTNLASGKSVNVTVADRGPYARHRIMDVSAKAARELGMTTRGVATVKVAPVRGRPRNPARLASK